MIGARSRNQFVRYLEYTQPRVRPEMMSHQRHPLVQPITCTIVPRGSQVTRGNARSGPARTLTACEVKADCASAGIGSSNSSAMKYRISFERDIGVSKAGSNTERRTS